jgi:hypothetical protein
VHPNSIETALPDSPDNIKVPERQKSHQHVIPVGIAQELVPVTAQ